MTKVMLEIVKPKVARPEVLPELARIAEHSEVALTDLIDPAIDPGAKHVARDGRRLDRLHCLVAQDPWLPVEGHVRDVSDADAGLVQAVLNGAKRKAAVVLDARKALLFRSRNDLAVVD